MQKLTFKPIILSAALALSLSAGLQQVKAEEMSNVADMESGIVLKEVSDVDPNYCHIKYMTFTERGLKSGDLEFNQSETVDMYGSCSFSPKGADEVKKQIALLNAGGDSGNDGGSED